MHPTVELAAGPLTLLLRPIRPSAGSQDQLVDLRAQPPADGMLPVRLLEDAEYLFEVTGPIAGRLELQPSELFSADDDAGIRGRLRTFGNVGILSVQILVDGVPVGSTQLEVQSAKLGYADEYRAMLDDIAREATALVLQRFAPTSTRLGTDWASHPRTAYERLLHAQQIIDDPDFRASVLRICADPHHEWVEIHQRRPAGTGARGSMALVRNLLKPGPRAAWPGGRLPSLPNPLDSVRTEVTEDTVPNRFVLFVLGRLEWVLSVVERALSEETDTPRTVRGRVEIERLRNRLQELTSLPLMTRVGRLQRFPMDNQVILKRADYRRILQASLLLEAGLSLNWSDGAQLLGAQRDVATLYEYWAFMQILRIVRELCSTLDVKPLITDTKDGLSLSLRRGTDVRLTGTAVRLGRELTVELLFNRTFRPRDDSWSLTMRPDISLRVTPANGSPEESVWVHLDAKYKLAAVGLADDDLEEMRVDPARDDLLKMHAYLGAIRRTVGSYVLFPASSVARAARRAYWELLPGIGAFSLRPTRSDLHDDVLAIKGFLNSVFEHVASVATQDRRHRYWSREAFGGTAVPTRSGWAPTHAPPADTTVLVGYVRSIDHWNWVHTHRLYNLRAEPGRPGAVAINSSVVDTTLVLLYDQQRVEIWRRAPTAIILDSVEMRSRNYPNPRGSYVALGITEQIMLPGGALIPSSGVVDLVMMATGRRGHPLVASWADISAHAQPEDGTAIGNSSGLS